MISSKNNDNFVKNHSYNSVQLRIFNNFGHFLKHFWRNQNPAPERLPGFGRPLSAKVIQHKNPPAHHPAVRRRMLSENL